MKSAENRTQQFSERTVPQRCEEELAFLAWTLRQNIATTEATNAGEIESSREIATEILIEAAAWLNRLSFEPNHDQSRGPTFKLLRGQFFRAMRRILDPRTSRAELLHALESAAEIIGSIGRPLPTRSLVTRGRRRRSIKSLRVPTRRR